MSLDLDHFEHLLRDRHRSLRARLDGVEDQIEDLVVGPGDTSSVPTHAAVQDAEGIDLTVRRGESYGDRLARIEDALARIEDGSFGRCESCGETISPERLEAVPYTTRCAPCARAAESAEEAS